MRKNILLAFFMAVVCQCNLFAATVIEKHWNCDPSLYPNTMTIVGVVEIDEAEQGNTSLEVGAFCGTECRGSEMLRSFPQVNRFLVFLTVYGEDNDAITFKLYDHGTGEELDAYVEGMTFTINAMHGTPVEPYEFNFIPYYTVTAVVNPSGTGSISGAGRFVAHSSMSLTATPNTGYGFVNWTENGEEVGTEPTLQFELLGNRSLVANFEMIMHHVDVGVNFDVAGSATGVGDFQEGSTVTVSATPNTGFLFDRWSENGETMSTSASYAFAIWEDRDLTAEFKLAITDTTASSCAEYEWHGQTYTSSGTYYDTMTSYLGIDSIVALHLTIYPAYAFNLYETACDSYLWNDTYYYESGDYEDVYQTIHGCDSIYTLHLTINQTRPLGNFTYMTPANNYVNRYTDVDFYWDGVVNANRYDFYFWEDGNDRPTNPTIANSTSVTAHRNGLEHGTTYHWCVVAKNECVELESPERTFICQLTPAMSVIPQSSLDFGEVEVGQSSTKNISVSGTALTEDISYAFLENTYGADAEFFAITPASNWNDLKGGTLQVTFTPVATQLYYNSAVRIASGTFVDTVYLTGSMANRFVFTTHVEDSRSQFVAGDTITITGHVSDVLGNVVPNLDVDVYLMVLGNRITKRTISDGNGDYSVTYVPRYSESGYYQVGSCERNKRETAVHDDFDVPGMSRTSNDFIKWELYQNDTLTGSISIRNRSRIPLGSIQVIPVTVPNGLEISFESLSLGALETGELNYTLTGTLVTTSYNYQEAIFQLLASDGTTMNLTCYFYCRKRRGDMDVYPPSVTTSMKRYEQKVISFQVTNNGNDETGPIVISLPNVSWMSVLGSDTLPSLSIGDSLAFSLMLAPDENVPLELNSGSFIVSCANGNGVSIPYDIEATSDSTGILIVDVTDDYTYNTNGGNGPHLADAFVKLVGYYSLETIAQGHTDEDGLFRVDTIPEGYYYLTIQAKSHSEYNNGIIYIEGGKTNRQSIYLQFEAISISWEVIPTEIEDEYDFELIADIKTNVPVPVVIFEGPSSFDTLAYGDTVHFSMTVYNHGLIDALDVQITMPIDDEYVFTPMFDFIDTLHPQTTVIVPCILTRPYSLKSNRGPLECKWSWFKLKHYWYCNHQKQWKEFLWPTIVRRECHMRPVTVVFPPNPDVNNNQGCTECPEVVLPGPDPGINNPGDPSNKTTPISTTSQDCTPCLKVIASVLVHIGEKILDVFVPEASVVPIADVFDCYIYEGTVKDVVNSLIQEYANLAIPGLGVFVGQYLSYSDGLLNCFNDLAGSYIVGQAASEIPVLGEAYNVTTEVAGIAERIHECLQSEDPTRNSDDLELSIDQFNYCANYSQACFSGLTNLFQEDEWLEERHIHDFLMSFMSVVDTVNNMVPDQSVQQLISSCELTSANDSIVHRFVDRWNRSVQYWQEGIFTINDLPEGYDNGFIQMDTMMYYPIQQAIEAAQSYGYGSVGEMLNASVNSMKKELVSHNTDVCAKISVQFKQTMTMTREAFEGTLRITNGHMTESMQDIEVDMVIKDANGQNMTNLFQINVVSMDEITEVDGTGSLAPQTEGVVQFLMIPTVEAAPDTSMLYSFGGSFTFLDPFSGLETTFQLYPVELTVNPSPNLYVDYFVQRNIISDDPLTEDTIEMAEEAEIAMMIRNLGAGDAKNVFLESSQPTIIENKNNLLISFDMTGAAMNGERRPLGLTDVPFGTIAGHTNGIAEWYFTSSLIGRVINSTARVIHNSSYGNPDLSLVSGVNTHELTKAIRAYGTLEDGINDFLVNEDIDFGLIPDKLYFSNGDTTNVVLADSLVVLDSITHLNNTVTMHMYPHTAGWNYRSVEDPGQGRYELISCTRSDGQEIPLNNVWITHVTIPYDDTPIHENLLHIVDTLSTEDMVTYTLVYDVVLIDTYEITATANSDEWGAVTGGGTYEEGSTCTLTATPADGYAFVNWTKDGEVVSTESTYSFTVTEAGDYIGIFGIVMDHTIALEQGWNWWSSYIDLEGTGLTQLENGLGEHGVYIKSQNNGFVGNGGSDWYGTLSSLRNQNMYMIQTNTPVQFTMSGVCVNASQIEMNTASGWNWIGYPLTTAQSVDDALSQFDASNGDLLKTMNKMCVYDEDGWYGTLGNMSPGQGYMLNSELSHNFYYASSRGLLKEEPNWLYHWNSKARNYENNMSFIAAIALNGKELRSEAYEVAAFCNGTSLGSTRLLYNDRRDRYYALLPVPGEEGMKLSFKLYDADLSYEYPDQALETYSFVINGVNGSLDEPVVLHFGSERPEEASSLLLYPNPVKKDGIVRLALPVTSNVVRVEIYNMLDVLVATKDIMGNSFNVGNTLSSGTYILRVYDGKEKTYYGKLIIE